MSGQRWLVCGSRTFDNDLYLRSVLDGQTVQRGKPAVIINGGMMGVDALSSYWAYLNGVDTWCFGALWGSHGKAAGPRRNKLMLTEGRPDLVIAVTDKPLASSRGTAHMVSAARQAGIEVVERCSA